MTGSHQEQSVKLSKCCLTSGLTPAMFISLDLCLWLFGPGFTRGATPVSLRIHLSHSSYTCFTPATPVSLQLYLSHSSYTCLTPATPVSLQLHLSHSRYTCLTLATPVSFQIHLFHSNYTCLNPNTPVSLILHLYHSRYICLTSAATKFFETTRTNTARFEKIYWNKNATVFEWMSLEVNFIIPLVNIDVLF